MVIYIEYAFLENFILDFILLYVSLKASRGNARLWRLLCSAMLGGVFAVIFPIFPLNEWGRYALKWATGFLLCFLAFGEIKSKNAWGRYALNCLFFFSSTFFFGGALTALHVEKSTLLLDFLLLSVFFLILVCLVYKKRAVERFLYDCKIKIGEKQTSVQGFYDTGNLATFENIPACFLSPEFTYLAVDAYGETLKKQRQKMKISTLSGEREISLFLGEIEITTAKGRVKRQVYFALFENSVKREYKLILHSQIFG